MIYGDNPQKIYEREDALGLKRYSYAPQISAVIQSGNLYVYCMGNPVYFADIEGKMAAAAAAAAGVAGGAAVTGGANFWNPVGWALLGTAAVCGIIIGACALADWYSENKKKNEKTSNIENKFVSEKSKRPIELPSPKKIKIDLDHIMSGHSSGGNRGGPNKDRFPWWMTAGTIEKAIREAYSNAEKIGAIQRSFEDGIEKVRQLFQGVWNGMTIQFWYNYTDGVIETAWPK